MNKFFFNYFQIKVKMDSNENSKEEENDFQWLQQNNYLSNDYQKNYITNKSNLKDNFNPISLLKSNLTSSKNQSNEENNLIDELSKLNLGNKGNSKDLAFNYYFGAGNNDNNKNLMIQKNSNEREIINNSIEGSRFMKMNIINNNNKNKIENENENFQEKINNDNKTFNNNNFILSQPYIPKKERFNFPLNNNNNELNIPNLNNQNNQNYNYVLNQIPNKNNNDNNNNYNLNQQEINFQSQLIKPNEKIPGKFFVIKSIDEANIIRSINFKIWCSTIKGNQKLQKAFKESEKKYPIYLFFSVNGSGKFMGLAQMASEVEYRVNFNYWSQNDKWKGFFFVNWIYIKDIPNRIFRQIINEYNDNKPVTSSRDTQEIFPSAGIKMLKIFKDYPQESSIFDNMSLDEKLMIYQQKNNNNNMRQINFKMNNFNNMNNMNINNMGNMNNMNLGGMNNMNNLNNRGNLNNMNMNNMSNMNNMINFNKMNLSQKQQMMMMMQQRQQMMNMNLNNNSGQDNNF